MSIFSERLDATLAALVLAGALVGCTSHRPPALAAPGGVGGGSSAAPEAPPTTSLPEGPDVRPVEGEAALGSDLAPGAAFPDGEGVPLEDVLFAYDSAALGDVAHGQLDRHAAWLQAHPHVRATIEGHCDDRGTVEYNLALGEQRARVVRDYLVTKGVAGDRLRVVSYGKERPLDPAPTEEAYAKNRRAHFALSRNP
jgi:peptidoglycan-associated lipoprotein